MSSLFTLGEDSELKFWISDQRLYCVNLEECIVIDMETEDISTDSVLSNARTTIRISRYEPHDALRSPVLLGAVPLVQHAQFKDAQAWLCFSFREKLVLDLSYLSNFSYKRGELSLGFYELPRTYESVVAKILKE
jgi:hypothetical protein